MAGKSGVSRIESFDTSEYATKIAAEVKDFNPEDFIDKKEVKRTDRFVQFGIAAAKLAFKMPELEITSKNAEQIGVYVGSGIGGLQTFEEQYGNIVKQRPKTSKPLFYSHDDCQYGFWRDLHPYRGKRA